jgi:hypothetical protein
MAQHLTGRLKLEYADLYDPWLDFTIRNTQRLDALFLGSFAVVPAEVPSASLDYLIRGGTYLDNAGALQTVADSASRTANATGNTYVYLKADGTFSPVGATAWPAAGAGKFHPLAIVTVGISAIAVIRDMRYPLTLIGS